MKVTLVNTNRYLEPPVVPVGLEYLIEPLRMAGHEVYLCDLAFSENPAVELSAALESGESNVVGFTVRNIDNVMFSNNVFFLDEISELISVAREQTRAHIIIGGTSTLCSVKGLKEYLGADCIVQGPGENALPALLETLSAGEKPPAWVDGWAFGINPDVVHSRGELIDYKLYLEGGNPAGLEFRKGCNRTCGFCVERLRPVLEREIEAVAAEARLVARAGAEMFFFCDSEVNLDVDRTKACLKALAEEDTGLRWSGYFQPVPFDRELAQLAALSGCRDLTLSVNSWNLAASGSWYGTADVKRFASICTGAGIKVAVDLIVGYPGEELSSVEAALDLAASLDVETVAVTDHIRIYEGTPVAALAVTARGRIHGKLESNPSMLKPVFYSGVDREWISSRISRDKRFVMADAERTVNYKRISESAE